MSAPIGNAAHGLRVGEMSRILAEGFLRLALSDRKPSWGRAWGASGWLAYLVKIFDE